jgi:hypothetical protein
VAGSTHNYYLCFAVSSFLVLDDEPDPDPDQFCVSSPLNFSICVYLLCVPMLLVRLRWLRFRAVASRSACGGVVCVEFFGN